MEVKGTYKLSYTLDRELKDLTLVIELRQVEGMIKTGQNIWQGYATLDGKDYDKPNLECCVDAKLAVERYGKQLKEELKANALKAGQSFRIKKEEIK
jgi:hypothetical protein